MPHKRNPIMSERMAGMARLLRGYALTGLENVSLWHERDISHSSAERVAIPDACLALDYMLTVFADLVENLVVDSDRMAENLASTYGLVYSQAVLLELVKTGISRDQAYRIVQRNALRAWDERRQLLDLLKEDPEVELDQEHLNSCFSAERFLANSEIVFQRLEESQL